MGSKKPTASRHRYDSLSLGKIVSCGGEQDRGGGEWKGH